MSERPSVKPGMGFGKMLLYLTVISICGIILFNYYKNNVADYTFIPKEMQVTYIPADFEFDVDDENMLAVLQKPHRYRREFDELIYKFNLSLLSLVANIVGNTLPTSQFRREYPANPHTGCHPAHLCYSGQSGCGIPRLECADTSQRPSSLFQRALWHETQSSREQKLPSHESSDERRSRADHCRFKDLGWIKDEGGPSLDDSLL